VFWKILLADPIFEDLFLNEMPDVLLLRLKAYKQRNLPEEEQDDDLDEKAEDDLTAYVCLYQNLSLQRIFFFDSIGIFLLCE